MTKGKEGSVAVKQREQRSVTSGCFDGKKVVSKILF